MQSKAIMKPVHPHGRGEHVPCSFHHSASAGSSPRAWGTRQAYNGFTTAKRFIPTGVGNTFLIPYALPYSSVHPHGRGEHKSLQHTMSWRAGSSPRAWGTRFSWCSPVIRLRFIPTGVGNTGSKARHLIRNAVHPHGRGEHPMSGNARNCFGGSSPRAWGTLIRNISDNQLRRFIPTGVGNTML